VEHGIYIGRTLTKIVTVLQKTSPHLSYHYGKRFLLHNVMLAQY